MKQKSSSQFMYLYISTYPNVYQYFINLSKNTPKTKKLSSGLIWRKGYFRPIRRTKNWIRLKGKKSTKRPTDTADRKMLGELEKEGLEQQFNYRPKDGGWWQKSEKSWIPLKLREFVKPWRRNQQRPERPTDFFFASNLCIV
jgi:hypothetical protein